MSRIVLITMLQLITITGFAQWTRLTSPSGPIKTLKLLDCGDQIFLFTEDAIYAREKGSVEWKYKSPARVSHAVYRDDTLFMIYNTYYLAYADVRKEHFYIEVVEESYTNDVTCIENSDNKIFIGSTWDGFKVFHDVKVGGAWDKYNDGLPRYYYDQVPVHIVYSIKTKADSVFIGISGTYGRIYRSKIGEYSWEIAGSPDVYCQHSCRNDMIYYWDGILFANYWHSYTNSSHPYMNSEFFYSTDNGDTFSPFLSGPLIRILSLEKVNDDYYALIKDTGILVTRNFGHTWTEMTFEGIDYTDLTFINEIGDDLYCGTKSNGVYLLRDSIWIPDNQGIESFKASQILSHDEGLYVSTGDSVYDYNYKDNSWENISPDVEKSYKITLDKMVKVNHNLIVTGLPKKDYDYSQGWNLLMRNEEGHWDERFTLFTAEAKNRSRSIFNDGERIYMFADKLCYSDNYGLNWTDVGGFREPHWMTRIGRKVYSASSCCLSRFWPDPEGWQYLGNIVDIMEGSGISPAGTDIAYFCSVQNCLFVLLKHFSPSYLVGWFRSRDGGFTWDLVNNGLEEVLSQNTYVHSHASNDSLLMIGLRSGEVIYTSNYGDSWKMLDYPDFGAGKYGIYGPLVINNDTLYLSVNQGGAEGLPGIWKYPINYLALSTEPKDIRESNIAIYPNPASERLYIADKECLEPKEFKIYSGVGTVVMAGQYLHGDGFDISSLAEGVYFLQITGSNTNYVGKFIITR